MILPASFFIPLQFGVLFWLSYAYKPLNYICITYIFPSPPPATGKTITGSSCLATLSCFLAQIKDRTN